VTKNELFNNVDPKDLDNDEMVEPPLQSAIKTK
jgi:hypothetical protein